MRICVTLAKRSVVLNVYQNFHILLASFSPLLSFNISQNLFLRQSPCLAALWALHTAVRCWRGEMSTMEGWNFSARSVSSLCPSPVFLSSHPFRGVRKVESDQSQGNTLPRWDRLWHSLSLAGGPLLSRRLWVHSFILPLPLPEPGWDLAQMLTLRTHRIPGGKAYESQCSCKTTAPWKLLFTW